MAVSVLPFPRSGISTNSGTVTISGTVSGVAGDILVAVIGIYSTHSGETITGVSGSGSLAGLTWTRRSTIDLASVTDSGRYFHQETWWAKANGSFSSETISATISNSAATTFALLDTSIWRGIDQNFPWDTNSALPGVTAVGRNTSTSTHNVSISTKNANCGLLASLFWKGPGGSGVAADSGWTKLNANLNTLGTLVTEYELVSSKQNHATQNVFGGASTNDYVAVVDALQAGIAVVDHNKGHGAHGSTSVSTASGISGKQNDVIVAVVGIQSSAADNLVTGVSDGSGFTWHKESETDLATAASPGTYYHQEIWWAQATADYSGLIVTATYNSGNNANAVVAAFSAGAANTVTPFDGAPVVSAVARSTTTTTHNVTFSTTVASDLLFSVLFADSATAGADSGWTILDNEANPSGGEILVQQKSVSQLQTGITQNVNSASSVTDYIATVIAMQLASISQEWTGTGALVSGASVIGVGVVGSTGTGALAAQSATSSGAGVSKSTGSGALVDDPADIFGTDFVNGGVGRGILAYGEATLAAAGRSGSTGSGALAAQSAAVDGAGEYISAGAGVLADQRAAIVGAGLIGSAGAAQLQSQRSVVAGAGRSASVGSGTLRAGRSTVAGLYQAAATSHITRVKLRGQIGPVSRAA